MRIWSETADRVARIAGGLEQAGMQRGDRVAILALNSDRYFELLYAIPWIGAVMVPVNTRLATPEIEYILEDSGARVLFVDGAMQAHAAALAGQMPTVEAMFCLDDDAPPAGMRPYEELAAGPAIADAGAGDDTLAGLFYTGGTTGKPKGVMLSHNNLVGNAMNVDRRRCSTTRTRPTSIPARCSILPTAPRPSASRLRRAPRLRAALRAADCCRPSSRRRSRTPQFVPTMINMLVNHPRCGRFRPLDPQVHPLRRLADARGRAAQGA